MPGPGSLGPVPDALGINNDPVLNPDAGKRPPPAPGTVVLAPTAKPSPTIARYQNLLENYNKLLTYASVQVLGIQALRQPIARGFEDASTQLATRIFEQQYGLPVTGVYQPAYELILSNIGNPKFSPGPAARAVVNASNGVTALNPDGTAATPKPTISLGRKAISAAVILAPLGIVYALTR